MSTESKKQGAERVQPMVTRPPEHEPLPCPRCDSNNTKFCYYNNYNLSQPRHFCKSCRRYWTRGGTLRNVPFGGGTRKSSNKRLPFATNSPSTSTYNPIPTNPVFGSASFSGEMNLNEPLAGGFTSLLSTQQDALGFVSLNGFGLGLGSALQGFGFGLGTWDWPLEQVGEGTTNGGNRGSVSGTSSGCDTWPIGGVEAELADGDCLGWPDLAISTPSDALK